MLAATPWHLSAQVPGLSGRVVRPDDPAYEAARRDFNQRFDVYPQAIVYCRTSADVANAVAWARSQKLPLAVRSGGHSYEAFSLSSGLVVDLSDMSDVDVDQTRRRVVAQPGIRLLPFYRALAPYGLTVAGGTCEGVGLGGLTPGGGIGFLTRQWGATIDNLIGLEMVDATGQVIRADESRNPDLFWACRGGGGSFGIITEMTFQASPVDDVTVIRMEWPRDQVGRALFAWQSLAPFWPDELTTSLDVNGPPSGSASLDGLYLGGTSALQNVLAPLLAASQPSRVDITTMSYLESAERFSGQSKLPFFFKAKSDYALSPLEPEAVETIRDRLAASPDTVGQASTSVQFQAYGGAVNRVPADATAFPHRSALLSMQYLAHWSDPADESASLTWIRDFYSAMGPFVSGYAYSNMCDLDLQDWPHAYYGANIDRLIQVKTRYDPSNLFRFAQSIPPDSAV